MALSLMNCIGAPLDMETGIWENLGSIKPANVLVNIAHYLSDFITVLVLVTVGVGGSVVSFSISAVAIAGAGNCSGLGTNLWTGHVVVYRQNEAAAAVNAFLTSLRQDFRGWSCRSGRCEKRRPNTSSAIRFFIISMEPPAIIQPRVRRKQYSARLSEL